MSSLNPLIHAFYLLIVLELLAITGVYEFWDLLNPI